MYRFYLRIFRSQWKILTPLILCVAASVGLNLWEPLLSERFLLAATELKVPLADLYFKALFIFGLTLAGMVFEQGGYFLGEMTAWKITNALRYKLTSHLIQLDLGFHKTVKPGELIERIDGDVGSTHEVTTILVKLVFSRFPMLIGCLIFISLRNLILGGLLFSASAVIILLTIKINKASLSSRTESRNLSSELSGNLDEWIRGREEISSHGIVPFIMEKLEVWGARKMKNNVSLGRWNWATMSSTRLFNIFGFVFLFYWGTKINYSISSAISAFIIYRYISLIAQPIMEISWQLKNMTGAAASLQRIEDLLKTESTLPDGEKVIPAEKAPEIRVSNLSFAYKEELVLKEISFTLKAGKTLGILGRTGCGKSTLARLLNRMYLPTKGKIEYITDNHSISTAELSDDSAADSIGVITQEVHLFNGTIGENLSMFNDSIGKKQLTGALAKAGLDSWLESQPEGLNTIMNGENGLSAGEAQLFALARVFLYNPSVIILDEPTSRMDPQTEKQLEKGLTSLLKDKTAVIIAHRLNTIRSTDYILVLEDGSAVEFGPTRKFENDKNSRFNTLLREAGEEVLL